VSEDGMEWTYGFQRYRSGAVKFWYLSTIETQVSPMSVKWVAVPRGLLGRAFVMGDGGGLTVAWDGSSRGHAGERRESRDD